jgi:VWFA-related protein
MLARLYEKTGAARLALLPCAMRAALAIAAAWTAVLHAQTPVFRAGAAVVPIDVRVIDREGRPVTDLKAGDFTIHEDGLLQEIRYFSPQALTPDASGATARLIARAGLSAEVAPQQRRVFLIVLGRGRLQEPAKGLDAMLRFVRERLMPQDLVAVLAYDRATDFTVDHERVARVIDRFRRGHERIEQDLRAQFTGLAALYGSRNVPASIQKAIDAVFDDTGTPATREVPPAPVANDTRLDEDARRTTNDLLRPPAPDAPPTPPILDSPFNEFVSTNRQTMQDVGNLYTGIEYLRQLEGEKHLVFVTEHGIVLPRQEDDRSLAAIAADARVVIDVIQTGGIAEPPPLDLRVSAVPIGTAPAPSASRQAFVIASLKTIAELTGGQASFNAYAETAVERINTATRFGYLLGYTPSNMRWDGRYRRITITTTRPDVTVLHRRGYYGRDVLTPFDRRQFVISSRMNAAAALRRDIRDLRVSAKATPGALGGQMVVDATIAATRVQFDSATSQRVATLVVALVGVDASLRTVTQSVEEVSYRLDEAGYLQARKDGLTFRGVLASPPSLRSIKVVVYDYAADLLGTTLLTVR